METKDIEKEKKKFDNYGKFAKILFVIVIITALLGISYAVFRTVAYGEKTNELTVGDVGLIITNENSSGITLDGVVPTTEEEGKQTEGYTFTLQNTGDYLMNYKLGFELSDDTTMPASSVRYTLAKEETEGASAIMGDIKPEFIDGKYVYYLEAGQIAAEASQNYTLKIWIDYNAGLEANGMKFTVNARADGEAVAEGTQAWALQNETALRTPIDDELDTMYTKDLSDDAEYAYTLTDTDKPIAYYIGATSGTYLVVEKDENYYMYAFTKNKYQIEIGKWYQTDSDKTTFSEYTGTAPISSSDYQNIYNQAYFDKIVKSFAE